MLIRAGGLRTTQGVLDQVPVLPQGLESTCWSGVVARHVAVEGRCSLFQQVGKQVRAGISPRRCGISLLGKQLTQEATEPHAGNLTVIDGCRLSRLGDDRLQLPPAHGPNSGSLTCLSDVICNFPLVGFGQARDALRPFGYPVELIDVPDGF